MDRLFEMVPELARVQGLIEQLLSWLSANVFVLAPLLQILAVGFAFLIARLVAPRIEKLLESATPPKEYERYFQNVVRFLNPQILPVIWIVLQWFTVIAADQAGWPSHVIASVVSLLTAWIIIRLASSVVANSSWSRAIAVIAWSIAALNIIGWLEPATTVLDSMAIQFGEVKVSMLGVGKAALALAFLLWLAAYTTTTLERRMDRMSSMSPSARVLVGKFLKIVLFTVAFVLALNSIGIDLTALAVFSGAVGLGLGFGLQKVAANLISGFILLLDKSVKPGDVIAIGETYGWINSLSARYVSVITRDGTEHLIPNEELISQRVENWSHSNLLVRQRLALGVSYTSDLRKAIDLVVEAALAEGRVLKDPEPRCLVRGFGDNAVDLELRFWLKDPQNGLANIKSNILLRVWDLFAENDITFPFPQRQLHIDQVVPVRIEKP